MVGLDAGGRDESLGASDARAAAAGVRRRVLVTGGAGYIGSIAVRMLLDRGESVTVLDTLERGHRAAVDSRARLVVGDVGDRAAVDDALADCDAVMHFAGYTLVAESQREPERYHDNNAERPLALLDAMARHGVSDLVFSSTAAVYGEPKTVPIPEDADLAPINAYGASKLRFERALARARDEWGLSYACLRYFNVVGAWPDGSRGEDHDPETHIVPLALAAAACGSTFHLFGDDYPTLDGTCVRDYVNVIDLVEAHLLALDALRETGEPLVCNLGTGSGHSNREVIAAVEAATGIPLTVVVEPRREGDPAALVASNGRAR